MRHFDFSQEGGVFPVFPTLMKDLRRPDSSLSPPRYFLVPPRICLKRLFIYKTVTFLFSLIQRQDMKPSCLQQQERTWRTLCQMQRVGHRKTNLPHSHTHKLRAPQGCPRLRLAGPGAQGLVRSQEELLVLSGAAGWINNDAWPRRTVPLKFVQCTTLQPHTAALKGTCWENISPFSLPWIYERHFLRRNGNSDRETESKCWKQGLSHSNWAKL